MALNIKKGRLITFLDIFLIFVIFIFLRNYMGRNNKNSTKLIKDKVTYTLLINSQKIKKDELLNIRIKLENRDKNQKFLEFKKAVPFNYVIEKDGKFIYKRDIMESMSKSPKKIYLNRYGKTEFGTEWYGNTLEQEEVEPGIYTLTVYSTDLDVNLRLNFEIIQEAE